MIGTSMIILDFFIVNVALPSIQSGLHASASAIEWVVAGYGLTFAVFLIAAGRIGDRVGRRRTFFIGLSAFVAASALCGLAPNEGVLVAARLAQGVGAALISPNMLSLLGVVYAGERRVKAITIYGLVMGLAAASGQLIGGLLIAANVAGAGWRTIFLINVPIGLVGLAMTRRLLPESRAERATHIDVGGMVLVTAALVALVLPLVQGRSAGWPAWTWMSFGLSAVLVAVFVTSQRRQSARGGSPLLDPVLFKNSSLRSGLATQLAFWCGQAAFFLVLALYLQEGRGLSPLKAGLVFSILAGAYLVVSMKAPALTLRYGRDMVFVGALALAAGDIALWVFVHHYGSGGPVGLLAPGLVLAGAGMGLSITPLTSTVLAHATPETAGSISGALSTMQQVGNALGVAVTGAIFYGALDHGVATAFSRSLVELTGLLIGVAVLTKCLPGRPGQVAAAPPAPQTARQTARQAAAQTAPAATGPAASTSPTTTKAA
ncbi:MAG TPA: MFS transporter [Acidimicrobiales bacterium]|nr:MFS transporter [Acidimicrobiales bacterium]